MDIGQVLVGIADAVETAATTDAAKLDAYSVLEIEGC
jgi:hypothetical protein